MGNHVGIERDPSPLFGVLDFKEENHREQEAKVKFNNKNNKNEFGSSLHLWRFFPDPDNGQDIKNTPVYLASDSFKAFDSLQCYLILHIFLEERKYPTTPPVSPAAPEGTGVASKSDNVTVTGLLVSCTETLTPRGLANCLEDAFSTNIGSARGSPADSTGLNYNIYIWNGKEATKMTRAVAMAKRFELVKALETRKLSQSLFLRGDKVPLTSVFRVDLYQKGVPNNGILMGEEGISNHLFRQLLRRDSSEYLHPKTPQSAGGSTTPNGKSGHPTSFSRLNQIFPENGSTTTTPATTPPTSPTKDPHRSKSEGSLKDLMIDASKETAATGDTADGNEAKDPVPPAKETDSDNKKHSDKPKKKKIKKGKSLKKGKAKSEKVKLPISKQMSISQPALVSKGLLPALDLSKKKPTIAPLALGIKGLDKANPGLTLDLQKAGVDSTPSGDDQRKGGDLQVRAPGDDPYQDSEVKIKSQKLKRFDVICSRITEDLFLGSQTVSMDKALLKKEGVTHILNCAGSICPEYYPGEFVYRTLYLTDGVKEDILCLLYDVIEWIDEVVAHKGKVFVHCQQGVSRSSAIMIGYLMWKKDWNYEEAQMFVKERRGVSSPNTGFICQLLFLEKRLHDLKRETRIYHITNHSRHDTDFLVGKPIRLFPVVELKGKESKSCYIVQVPECFYIWVGGNYEGKYLQVAEQTVRRVQAFEKATQNVKIVHQSNETPEFKEFLTQLSTHRN